MKTYKEKIRELEQIKIIENGNENRFQRKAISELRKEGIVFIPIAPFVYRRIELCNGDQRDDYINSQIASVHTNFFNTILPIKKYMSAEQLKELHGGGLFETLEE